MGYLRKSPQSRWFGEPDSLMPAALTMAAGAFDAHFPNGAHGVKHGNFKAHT